MSGVRIAALLKWLMKIHSSPPILYYGFKYNLINCEFNNTTSTYMYSNYINFALACNSYLQQEYVSLNMVLKV